MKKKKVRASNIARKLGAEARTERNKKVRMAAHAKRYPKISTKIAAERRALGRNWKLIAQQRAEAAAKPARGEHSNEVRS